MSNINCNKTLVHPVFRTAILTDIIPNPDLKIAWEYAELLKESFTDNFNIYKKRISQITEIEESELHKDSSESFGIRE